jgi:hypothetical protein
MTKSTEDVSTGAASATRPTAIASEKHSPSSLDLIYASVSGFIIGFCIAAGVGIVFVYWIKSTGGINGE